MVSVKNVIVQYEEGELVRAKSDPEKNTLIVTGYYLRGDNVYYECACMDTRFLFAEYEIEPIE